jgi:drug/metabolite transporter (DMT)-like permease
MSDLPASAAAPPARPHAIFDQRLFELSPAGTLPTSVAIFVFFMGSFEILALATHYPLGDQLSFSPREGAWPATVLSLLIAVVLGMQRYTRLKDLDDAPALERVIHCDAMAVAFDSAEVRGRVRRAAAVGAIAGIAGAFAAVPAYVRHDHLPIFLWFALVLAITGALFARGAVLTRAAARHFSARIDRDLKIDLLRVDELSIIGRSSARTALIWLCAAAVVCLFFVSGNAPVPVIATIVLAAGMAFWIFFRSLDQVHRRIRDAKRAELDRLRHSITEARTKAVDDHAAAARLHGLLAYETRIEAVHEWPFDQLTLIRVTAYVLIPAVPAFGQAAVKLVAQHFVL